MIQLSNHVPYSTKLTHFATMLGPLYARAFAVATEVIVYKAVGRYQILGRHPLSQSQNFLKILEGHIPLCPPVPTALVKNPV